MQIEFMSITCILKMPVFTACSLTFILEQWFSTGDILHPTPLGTFGNI